MELLYILKDRIAFKCNDALEWAAFMAQNEQLQIGLTQFDGAVVSTVFLGIDYNHFGLGDPLLFETMVFYGDRGYGSMRRYFTWAEATVGHEEVSDTVREEIERSVTLSQEVLEALRANE